MPEMEISKTFRFEAAHRLSGVEASHKCATMHGHSYEVTVSLQGPVDPRTGFVMDYAELSAVCKPALARLDHAILNDIEGLANPTSENLCLWLWRQLKPHLPLLSKLLIRETGTSGCTYCGA